MDSFSKYWREISLFICLLISTNPEAAPKTEQYHPSEEFSTDNPDDIFSTLDYDLMNMTGISPGKFSSVLSTLSFFLLG